MNEQPTEPILVNGETVSESMIEQELYMLRERYAQEMSPQEMEDKEARIESDARENAVERVLLMQQARKEITNLRSEEIDARYHAFKQQYGGEEEFEKQFNLEADEVERIRSDIEDSVRLEKYFDLICRDVPRPTGDDSRAYYDAYRTEFTIPEQVRAAHIVKTPSPEHPLEKIYADLLNIRESLIRGADFDEVAAEHSDCRDGGHDLGYFSRGQMIEAFEKVAFSTKPGELSDVFQTEFGYHIVKVIDFRPEEIQPYEDVRYDIEARRYEERKNEAIGAVVDQLREGADIRNLMICS